MLLIYVRHSASKMFLLDTKTQLNSISFLYEIQPNSFLFLKKIIYDCTLLEWIIDAINKSSIIN